MDYVLAVSKIYPEGVNYNPACFDFSEEEARERKLWRDDKAMPSIAECKKVLTEYERTESYKEKRRLDYEKEGLSILDYLELIIEDDQVGMQAYKQKRNAIKAKHPKIQK